MKTETEEEIINILGSKTILKFSFLSDGIADYTSVVPIQINNELYDIRLSMFYEELDTIMGYNTAGFIVEDSKVFELSISLLGSDSWNVIYHKKYTD